MNISYLMKGSDFICCIDKEITKTYLEKGYESVGHKEFYYRLNNLFYFIECLTNLGIELDYQKGLAMGENGLKKLLTDTIKSAKMRSEEI